MLDQLESLDAKFQEIEAQLQDPAVVSDMKRLRELSKLRAELEPVVQTWHLQRNRIKQLEEAEGILGDKTQDPELREMAEMEIPELKAAIQEGEADLKRLLVPKDPKDARNVILEVRAGTGGEEAALFAGEVFRMYVRFAERRGFKVNVPTKAKPTRAGSRKWWRRWRARAPTPCSASKAACTGSSGCPRPRPRAASTPRPAPWR